MATYRWIVSDIVGARPFLHPTEHLLLIAPWWRVGARVNVPEAASRLIGRLVGSGSQGWQRLVHSQIIVDEVLEGDG